MTITLDERSIRECVALALSSLLARPITADEVQLDHIGSVENDVSAIVELVLPPRPLLGAS